MTIWTEGRVHCVDCLEAMVELPGGSVNLMATDPPYFKVKGEAWDRQWDRPEQFIAWVGRLCEQWQRILAPNGSLYVFASPKMAARVEVEVGRWFEVLNHIVWRKPPFGTKAEMFVKEDLRCFFPASESIIFAEHRNVSARPGGEAWNSLIHDSRIRQNMSRQDVSEYVVGSRSGACWNWESGIRFPCREHWQKLRDLFPRLPRYQDVERPFTVTADVPYTDVWDFRTVGHYKGKHPCEKPLDMMEHIVTASSRPGDLVLDGFAGSGTTGVAAVRLGRRFIGFEINEDYCRIANERIEAERKGQDLKSYKEGQETLFNPGEP